MSREQLTRKELQRRAEQSVNNHAALCTHAEPERDHEGLDRNKRQLGCPKGPFSNLQSNSPKEGITCIRNHIRTIRSCIDYLIGYEIVDCLVIKFQVVVRGAMCGSQSH
jgi:hypothetical protein